MKKLSATDLKALVDELGQLDSEISPLEDKKKKADALRAKVREQYAGKPAEQGFSAEGFKFTCTIGAAGNERSIVEMKDVFAKVGAAKFLDQCSFTLKKLDDLLNPADVALLVSTARTGTRPVKTFAKAK